MPEVLPEKGDQLRLVAVHAHPDDESSKGAGSMARYVREGAQVTVITCTGGERGDILNPQLAGDETILADMPAVRRTEMAAAQRVLGVDHEWLGFVDSGLPEGEPKPELPEGCFALVPVEEAARPLVEAIRRLRPHVLTTYDENGGYPHPDHIQAHRVSVHAFEMAADPEYAPELGEPWEVSKLYYINGFSRSRFTGIATFLRDRGTPDEELEAMAERFPAGTDRLVTTRVDISDQLEVRDAALRAHATQVDPLGFFFHIPNDVLRESRFATDDYELRTSRIGVTLPETDLFAGLR
ncbi:mycothiol conjugate amidase Mca [Brachybacterium endophyticum]|uniref:Mycothiol S-conjugate amidase n=1 Tax=Brachybacterium endophyticum TaxID=2182385 RepID=A0A2U2RPR8_9MICO|nr:mycothiol conjugate amidase Mca [Brachybacterium endophyticum]PWH07850.1 mycothiol conjugate amidase Mca [Brachybacterium endophyticum]